MIPKTKAIVLNDREIRERFVRATGDHGQNAKKEATAVELRVDLQRSSLPLDVRARLIRLAGKHVTKSRTLLIVSGSYRSQARNREAARARLAALVKRAATPPKVRVGTTSRPLSRKRTPTTAERSREPKRKAN
jgi:ribosome-associated protein